MKTINQYIKTIIEKEYKNIAIYRHIRFNKNWVREKELKNILMTQQFKVSQLNTVSRSINYPVEQFKIKEIEFENDLDLVKHLYKEEMGLLDEYENLYKTILTIELDDDHDRAYFRQMLKTQKLHVYRIKQLMNNQKININDHRTKELKEFTRFFKTNWEKHKINCNELKPVRKRANNNQTHISELSFISTHEAKSVFLDRDRLLVVERKNKQKAYPIEMLTFNEIINDTIDGLPIVITHCPLSGKTNVFKRILNNKRVLQFGSTGLIRNSNSVLYDDKTETLWQQGTGEAIVGYYVSNQLTMIPSQIIDFKTYKTEYKEGLILARTT
ncbi:DUF3179 domain-containing (seleno)protein [Haloplasma contractile]|uniref:DUF3179 domain-containing (seleno)protein n=1 Tax=Haloplasma contractile TaxID=471825 RepID=UPI0002123327|nr:DUF3179 domain-containing (seleno)protein [Haloplasma contractile]